MIRNGVGVGCIDIAAFLHAGDCEFEIMPPKEEC